MRARADPNIYDSIPASRQPVVGRTVEYGGGTILDKVLHRGHYILSAFPLSFLLAALITDVIYASSKNNMWADFSYYLIWAGAVTAGLASLVGVVNFLRFPESRTKIGWTHVVTSVLMCVFAALNIVIRWNRVHIRGDRLTGGIFLSAMTVFMLLVAAWSGSEMVTREKVVPAAAHEFGPVDAIRLSA